MEELNTFEKTLPDKLEFLIKLKQFVSSSVQVYHENHCPDGKLYFQKSEIKNYGISDAIHLGFGERIVNEYQKLIKSYRTKI